MAADVERMMLRAAAQRALVRLADGELVTLVGWGRKRPGHTSAGAGPQARVEFQNGRRRTIRKDDVLAVEHWP